MLYCVVTVANHFLHQTERIESHQRKAYDWWLRLFSLNFILIFISITVNSNMTKLGTNLLPKVITAATLINNTKTETVNTFLWESSIVIKDVTLADTLCSWKNKKKIILMYIYDIMIIRGLINSCGIKINIASMLVPLYISIFSQRTVVYLLKTRELVLFNLGQQVTQMFLYSKF